MSRLLLANLPHDCSEREIQEWIESRGYTVRTLRVVRDLVTGASPVFAYLTLTRKDDHSRALIDLNGQVVRGRRLVVKRVNAGPALFSALPR
jgi:hypothetical protein